MRPRISASRPAFPVAQGGADAFIGMIGLGVTEPGEMALITGSSHLHLGVVARPVHAPGVWGTYMDAVYPGQTDHRGRADVDRIGHRLVQAPLRVSDDVRRVERGSGDDRARAAKGCVVLDHFQGNRTPYTDAVSRGAITGLTLKHTPAHVYRAIVEGICLGTKLIVENFGDAFQARRIVVAGGATQSPLWLQIHADTIGAPLELTEVAGRARARLRHPRRPRRGTLLDHRGRRQGDGPHGTHHRAE